MTRDSAPPNENIARHGWSWGLTAATDDRVARMAHAKRGHRGWSRGLTAATDTRVAKSAAKALGRRRGPYRTRSGAIVGDCPVLPINVEQESDYAYVLGMYLGDGHLARLRRTWVLRIYLDMTQPEIADRCAQAVARLNKFHRVGRSMRGGMTIVRSNGVCWLRLIPQHGPGRKHKRAIRLDRWQREIIERVPMSFLRGLIESDGCRSTVSSETRSIRPTTSRTARRTSLSYSSGPVSSWASTTPLRQNTPSPLPEGPTWHDWTWRSAPRANPGGKR